MAGILPDEVHKKRPENVWLHSPVRESPHSMRSHFAIPSRGQTLRFAELLEVQRQLGILQAHRQLGVPDNAVFVLNRIALKFVTRADVQSDGGTIRAQIVATSARGRPRSLSQYFSIESPSGLVAVGSARASLIPQMVYDRVRGLESNASPPGRSATRSVFGYESALHVDSRDPLLSDHPSDHLTAMQAIADVERVALLDLAAARIRTLKLEFYRYAGLLPAPLLRLNISAQGKLDAEITQQGARCAEITGVIDMKNGER
ncbi:AfsA-related hotdog domain-containing protein [Microbacterium foliorum]|uniref:AfsA-related hotdog domain-containing protein n=1 Tax=Microbacterium foliorum TaxID=104336 RepID=UPI0013B46870|nr:AfsA-related hotdog domain-containing protein [Microbacterium foliorum]